MWNSDPCLLFKGHYLPFHFLLFTRYRLLLWFIIYCFLCCMFLITDYYVLLTVYYCNLPWIYYILMGKWVIFLFTTYFIFYCFLFILHHSVLIMFYSQCEFFKVLFIYVIVIPYYLSCIFLLYIVQRAFMIKY